MKNSEDINKRFAYSYVRMSTKEQLRGDSLRRQQELSENYAKEFNLHLVPDMTFLDIGVSAFKGDNLETGALGRFVAACKDGKIPKGSYLLVESLDRISRNDVHLALSLFLNILHLGVNVATLCDRRVYDADDPNATDLIVSITIMMRANEESVVKSQRVSAAWAAKRSKANNSKLTARCPNWLSLSADRTSFAVDRCKEMTVRRIFQESLDGMGANQIARRLNQEGLLSFSGKQTWSKSYVTKILKNPAVLGEYQMHKKVDGIRTAVGEPIVDYFPRIIDDGLFNRVQLAMSKRATSGKGRKGSYQSNLFTGLATCGYCGSAMHLVNKGPGPKGGKYLKCSGAIKGLSCNNKSWRYQDFEESFIRLAEGINFSALIDNGISVRKLKLLESEIADLEHQLSGYIVAFDHMTNMFEDDSLEIPRLAATLSDQSVKIKSCEAKLHLKNTEALTLKTSQTTSLDIDRILRDVRQAAPEKLLLTRTKLASGLKSIICELKVFVDGVQRPEKHIDEHVVGEEYFRASKGNPTFLLKQFDGSEKIVVVAKGTSNLMVFRQKKIWQDGLIFTRFEPDPNSSRRAHRQLDL